MSTVEAIIIFQSSRVDNLRQMLRFLERRERLERITLVCQDSVSLIDPKYRQLNLRLETYHRARMFNEGVYASDAEILLLLDGDRILPPGYFARTAASLKPGQVSSTPWHYRLTSAVDDDAIESGKFECFLDAKSVENDPGRKNMFSGNTVMYKCDYISMGGMDEKYVGYGFLDNDTTEKTRRAGYTHIWSDDKELHLHHSREVCWGNSMTSQLPIMTAINANRYHQKWNQHGAYVARINAQIAAESWQEDLWQSFCKAGGPLPTLL